MSSSIRYLLIGLGIGMTAAALVGGIVFAAAYMPVPFQPTSTTIPSATDGPTMTALPPSPTPLPTFTPVATLTPAMSPTPVTPTITATTDAVQAAIDSGGLIFSGPLSNDQQMALYKSSLYYVESNVPDSKRLAKAINGVGYGDPSNICGPLAIAILRDAGLMTLQIKPHDFWLLDPMMTDGQRLLKLAFPPERYVYTKSITPLNKMDWHMFPLEPGDFLFIWHGSGGNFDHMLVVNRVDSNQRAYAVTNFSSADGYIIAEAMLYDPNDPTVGLFHAWTQERDAILGSTGFGGFDLWRLRQP